MLQLEDKPCLVVGGGQVAERRIQALLDAGAHVRVVSPRFTERIDDWVSSGRILGMRRNYEPGDERGTVLVVAATNDPTVNDEVCHRARAAGCLVNHAGEPEQGDFIVPSVMRKGRLLVAVSTSGAAPSVAAELRRRIESVIGEDMEAYLDAVSELRSMIRQAVADPAKRQQWLKECLKQDISGLIRNGQWEQWKQQLQQRMSEANHANHSGWDEAK